MFSALRRAWRAYVTSIPDADDDLIPVDDPQNRRRPARPERVVPQTGVRFQRLAALLCAHLPLEVAQRRTATLAARLKADDEPGPALAHGITAGGRDAVSQGFIALDWKARDEIAWQAEALCAAHGLDEHWPYDDLRDDRHAGWQEHQEVPVQAPLRAFAEWLACRELVLVRVGIDGDVFAFAVATDAAQEALALCEALGIEVLA